MQATDNQMNGMSSISSKKLSPDIKQVLTWENDRVLLEEINQDYLYTLIQNLDHIKNNCDLKKSDGTPHTFDSYQNLKTKLGNLLLNYNSSNPITKYSASKNNPLGRMTSDGASIQGLNRQFRNLLIKETCIDLDIVNSHPSIFEEFMGKCVDQKIIPDKPIYKNSLIAHYNANVEKFKKEFVEIGIPKRTVVLLLDNGRIGHGSLKTLTASRLRHMREFGLNLNQMKSEIDAFYNDYIKSECGKLELKLVKKSFLTKKKNGGQGQISGLTNHQGSVMSRLYQRLESKILDKIITTLQDSDIHVICALYDGAIIKKPTGQENIIIPNLISKVEKAVKEHEFDFGIPRTGKRCGYQPIKLNCSGVKIKLVSKAFTECFDFAQNNIKILKAPNTESLLGPGLTPRDVNNEISGSKKNKQLLAPNDYCDLLTGVILNSTKFTKYRRIYENTKFIKPILFENGVKGLIINAPCGSGKSYASIQHILEKIPYGKKILIMSPRISFAECKLKEINQKITQYYEENGVQVPKHVDFENDVLFHSYREKTNGGGNSISNYDRVICSPESMHKFKGSDWIPDIIIIDEIEANLSQMISTVTNGRNHTMNVSIMKKFFRLASSIVALDAYVTSKTLRFFDDLEIRSLFIDYSWAITPTKKKAYIIDSHKIEIDGDKKDNKKVMTCKGIDILHQIIVIKLAQGKRVFYECCSKKEAMCFVAFLTGFPNLKIANYWSDNNEVDIDDWYTADIVIYTTTITVGINYDTSDPKFKFDCGFLYASSQIGALIPDMIQGLHRFRHIKDNEIYIHVNQLNYKAKYTPTPANLRYSINRRDNNIKDHLSCFDNTDKCVNNLLVYSQLEVWYAKFKTVVKLYEYLNATNCDIVKYDLGEQGTSEKINSLSKQHELSIAYIATATVDKRQQLINNIKRCDIDAHMLCKDVTTPYSELPMLTSFEIKELLSQKGRTLREKQEIQKYLFTMALCHNDPAELIKVKEITPGSTQELIINAWWKYFDKNPTYTGNDNKFRNICAELQTYKFFPKNDNRTVKLLELDADSVKQQLEHYKAQDLKMQMAFVPYNTDKILEVTSICKLLGVRSSIDFETEFTLNTNTQIATYLNRKCGLLKKTFSTRDKRKVKADYTENNPTDIVSFLNQIYSDFGISKITTIGTKRPRIIVDGVEKRIRVFTYKFGFNDKKDNKELDNVHKMMNLGLSYL
jgi:hypothetical protein